MIYVIQAGGEDGPVKIGLTYDPEKRLAELQTGNPEILTLLRVLEGDAAREAEIHSMFSHLKIRGEWFHFAPRMLTLPIKERATSRERTCEGCGQPYTPPRTSRFCSSSCRSRTWKANRQ